MVNQNFKGGKNVTKKQGFMFQHLLPARTGLQCLQYASSSSSVHWQARSISWLTFAALWLRETLRVVYTRPHNFHLRSGALYWYSSAPKPQVNLTANSEQILNVVKLWIERQSWQVFTQTALREEQKYSRSHFRQFQQQTTPAATCDWDLMAQRSNYRNSFPNTFFLLLNKCLFDGSQHMTT